MAYENERISKSITPRTGYTKTATSRTTGRKTTTNGIGTKITANTYNSGGQKKKRTATPLKKSSSGKFKKW